MVGCFIKCHIPFPAFDKSLPDLIEVADRFNVKDALKNYLSLIIQIGQCGHRGCYYCGRAVMWAKCFGLPVRFPHISK